MTTPRKTKRRRDAREQGRLDFNARPALPDNQEMTAEELDENRKEPLPGQAKLPWEKP